MDKLHFHTITNYTTIQGAFYPEIPVSYQRYGQELFSAPVVVVNHALTGNSDLTSPQKGWWRDVVGYAKLIDLNKFTVVAFNIPGNGYDGWLIENYRDFIAADMANIFNKTLTDIGIKQVFAVIGGSLGGSLAWEMAVDSPGFIEMIIPIASDWKSTDWIIGHNAVQQDILLHSATPLQTARKMAMLSYRTPASFERKFNRSLCQSATCFNVESWLNYHGHKLNERFQIQAYLLMNHLLSSIDISRTFNSFEQAAKTLQTKVIQIAINSDLFFVKEQNLKTKKILDQVGVENGYFEIESEDGHDAFLIESGQITNFLKPFFNPTADKKKNTRRMLNKNAEPK